MIEYRLKKIVPLFEEENNVLVYRRRVHDDVVDLCKEQKLSSFAPALSPHFVQVISSTVLRPGVCRYKNMVLVEVEFCLLFWTTS